MPLLSARKKSKSPKKNKSRSASKKSKRKSLSFSKTSPKKKKLPNKRLMSRPAREKALAKCDNDCYKKYSRDAFKLSKCEDICTSKYYIRGDYA